MNQPFHFLLTMSPSVNFQRSVQPDYRSLCRKLSGSCIAKTLLCLFWLILVIPANSGSPVTSQKPPNILLIVSDDQAWTDYGFMGHPHLQTPNLDRLARRSLQFHRGYVPSSLCCPSLASLITGRYPHQHGVVCNDPPRPSGMNPKDYYASESYRAGREQLSRFVEQVPTLPRLLQSKGYLSFQSGKWWQNHFSRGGFTHGMTLGDGTRGGRHGDAGLEIGRKTLQPIYDFIATAKQADRPWMVWYAPMMPHDPHTPPDRLLAKYRARTDSLAVAKYWAMVEWFDESCGQLITHLERTGMSKDTVVAYVTDNGWITDPQSGRYAPRSKQSPYDGGLRTPILLHWPGRIQPHKDDHAVSSLDLMPTLLKLTGTTSPPGLGGLDLLDRGAIAKRRAVFGACFTHDAVDLDRPSSGLRWRWMVQGNWKLIVPNPPQEPNGALELYELRQDPGEFINRAPFETERVERMREDLERWWPGN